MQKDNLFKNLNKEQVQAVTHKAGPLLIIAGAGTGKTTVLTNRVAWLIEQGLAKPEEILALTFTEKAAKEMDNRILEILPMGMLDFTATTFHSFCQNLLKEYGIHAGISPDFKLLTESQQILFIKQNLNQFKLNIYKPVSSPDKFISALIKLFSRAKDEIVSIDDYEKLSKKYLDKSMKNPEDLELKEQAEEIHEQATAYQKYEELKDKNGYFDFGDLIVKTLQLLNSRPSILSKIQNRYKYIFVDEFQDTNYAQAQIAYLIADKNHNITVVGDDDQSIYKFRGAAISNMMEFVKHYPNAKVITLIHNYRSSKQILDASYKIIINNNPERLEIKEKVDKKLISDIKGVEPTFWHFSDGYNEVEEIVKRIIIEVETKNKKFGDFAILIRANSHADDFIALMKDNGIPYHFVGSRGLYDREEIRELRSYLKVLFNPDDNLALFHVAWANQYKIDKILLRRLTNIAKQKSISLFEISEHIDNYIEDNNNDKNSINKIINLIKRHLSLSNSYSTSKILVDYIHKSGMYELFQNIESYKQQEIFENIRIFFSKIAEFERVSDDKTIFSFVDYLNLIVEVGDNPGVFEADKFEDAVNIMTVHASKGLEFDTVFMPNLVDGRFPSGTRKDPIELPEEFIKESLPGGNVHIQEERRLFYVAMTRAKNQLFLCASDRYSNNKEDKKISRFIGEAVGDKVKDLIKHDRKIDLLEEKTVDRKLNKQKKETNEIILSPSNLETFDECPKKFEYGYLFKLSGETTISISFGNSIHNTLRDYYRILINDKKIKSDQIEKIYKNNWQPEGYSNKIDMDNNYKKGVKIITNYIKSDKIDPIDVEKNFDYKVGNCKLTGRIDRINKTDDGLEIIDYKTGDGRKKTISELSSNIPLWIYALYMSEKYEQENIFLILDYIVSNKVLKIKVDQKKLDKKREKIESVCNQIDNSITNHDYPAKPSEFSCKRCQFKNLCPYKYKGA